jgi:hypothetical protein
VNRIAACRERNETCKFAALNRPAQRSINAPEPGLR